MQRLLALFERPRRKIRAIIQEKLFIYIDAYIELQYLHLWSKYTFIIKLSKSINALLFLTWFSQLAPWVLCINFMNYRRVEWGIPIIGLSKSFKYEFYAHGLFETVPYKSCKLANQFTLLPLQIK